MGPIWPDSSWEDIEDLYHEVYQLWRLPGKIRRWRHVFARRSWILSKKTSGISGLLHCWRQNQGRAQPIPLGSTPKLNSMPGTMPLLTGSWAISETPAKKPWLWQETPTNEHWQWQHFWRTKLRGWATLSATVIDALEATDTQVAAGKGDPGLWFTEPKSPDDVMPWGPC